MENHIVWLGVGIVVFAVLLLAVWLLRKNKKEEPHPRVATSSPPPAPAGQKDFKFSPRPQSLPSGDNVHLQLEILRQTLDLTTAILLWADAGDKNLQILSVASLRDDIVQEPFPRGSGIIGGLRPERPEIAVCPVPQHLTIPYYTATSKTGSLLALSIPVASNAGNDEQNELPATAILCLDRESESPWTEQEREVMELTCRKLSHDLRFTHKMEETNRNMEAIHQICRSMLELNQVLELQAVFEATMKTVKQLTSADFMTISLLEGEEHRIVMASGPKSSRFHNLSFPADDGLVGQAIKLRRWMPAHANYQEDYPVFSNSMRIAGLESLLILPLLKGEQEAIGALTFAGKKPDMFPKERREILQVIACQVATKIELAKAHEKIFELATTDGLTGLANHRTFQHAFDNMLHRALRQSTPLTMVLCDLDFFKKINDSFGHPFGDVVLQEVAKVLAGSIRNVDLAARYGGEEFALLLEDSNINGARKQVERVRRAISGLEFHHSGNIIKISMSFGLASFPDDGKNKDDLIKKADQAMYHAKARGRNRSVCWSDTQQAD